MNRLVDLTGRSASLVATAVDARAAAIVVGCLSALETSGSPETAFGHLAHAVESLGFGAIVYTAIPLTLGAAERLSPVFLASTSFSPGFLAHYEQAGLAARDFTIERALAGNVETLDWHEERARGRLDARQREVVDIARADYAIRNALSLPTRSDRHVIAGASVACDEPAERFGVLKAERLGALRTIVRAFHYRAFQLPEMQRRFYADFLEPLTNDERCVIRLLVEGHRLKSSLDLCGISSTRAGNLRSSLYRRLGVGNASELAYLVGVHGVDRLL